MSERPYLMGSELEFGISSRDPRQQNHVTNSMSLVGFCPDRPAPEALWDYDGENPLLDLFGRRCEGEREDPDAYANRALNKPLANGGRLYVDGAHPEYSSPEVTDPLDLVRYESAGEVLADRCRQMAERAGGQPLFSLFKNNSDGKGNSYGYHENHLLLRRVPVKRLQRDLVPFLITRQLFCGAGKVGAENGRPDTPFQMSQRADFFETVAEINTMVRRPLFNTRDEPHADPDRYLRLHVIPGDANMSQVSTFLKTGTLALVLRLIEDDALGEVPIPVDPVTAFWETSRDLTFAPAIQVAGGRMMSPLDIQAVYLERVKDYARSHPLPGSFPQVIDRWEAVLAALADGTDGADRQVDWRIKHRLIDTYLERKGLDWDSPRAKAMDLQYHDLDPARGLFFTLTHQGFAESLVATGAIVTALSEPPEDTRAWFRGQCQQRYGKAVYGVSWTSVLLDMGSEVRRIPTLNPFRGTRATTESLLDACPTVEALVAMLEQG